MAASVMIIAPHPDDEAIGCGGAIILHRQRGDQVKLVFLTSGECGIKGMAAAEVMAMREAEAHQAARILDAPDPAFLRLPDQGVADNVVTGISRLAELVTTVQPDLMYLPHEAEAHPDHQAAMKLVRGVIDAGAAPTKPELRVYEVWTPMEHYGWPEDITPVMARKLAAIRCYQSQLKDFRYDRAVRGLNAYRGILAGGCRYAEVFRYAST
jgi:N-acetylglucosamine malate deacetylase 1